MTKFEVGDQVVVSDFPQFVRGCYRDRISLRAVVVEAPWVGVRIRMADGRYFRVSQSRLKLVSPLAQLAEASE